jgi:hypothetical protein
MPMFRRAVCRPRSGHVAPIRLHKRSRPEEGLGRRFRNAATRLSIYGRPPQGCAPRSGVAKDRRAKFPAWDRRCRCDIRADCREKAKLSLARRPSGRRCRAPPRHNRSGAPDSDADLNIGLRIFPSDNASSVTPKLCGQTQPASIGRRRQQPGRAVFLNTVSHRRDRLFLRKIHGALSPNDKRSSAFPDIGSLGGDVRPRIAPGRGVCKRYA